MAPRVGVTCAASTVPPSPAETVVSFSASRISPLDLSGSMAFGYVPNC